MIFDTTYTNKDYIKSSIDTVGNPFSFIEKVKMLGAGSSRFVVDCFSTKLQPKNSLTTVVNYANIELRPKGIIIHYTNGLARYSWVIPFYRLVIYNAQTFSIHANGHYIKFKKNKNYRENKTFIAKMIDLKNTTLQLEYYDN